MSQNTSVTTNEPKRQKRKATTSSELNASEESPAFEASQLLDKYKSCVANFIEDMSNKIEIGLVVKYSFKKMKKQEEIEDFRNKLEIVETFGIDVFRLALSLLFAKRSLLAIYFLFVDTKDTIECFNLNDSGVEQKISDAQKFIITAMGNLLERNGLTIIFDSKMNIAQDGYELSLSEHNEYYSDNNELNTAEISLSTKLFDWYDSATNQEKENARYFTSMTLIHELIHVLGFLKFGRVKGRKISTPELSKFKIKTLRENKDINFVDSGFAYEMLHFGALVFVHITDTKKPLEKTILLDFFPRGENTVCVASQDWLNEIRKGSEANLYIEMIPKNTYSATEMEAVMQSRFRFTLEQEKSRHEIYRGSSDDEK